MVAAQRPEKRSFEELWRALAEVSDEHVGEIVAGEIRLNPRPNPPHVAAQSELGYELTGPFSRGRGGPGGWIFRDGPRVRFGTELRVPDLAGWRTERFQEPRVGPYPIAPDWICEVLSERTAATDRSEKMPLYAAHGVGHLWLLEPVLQSLEIYRLHHGNWLLVQAHAGGATVRAEPFDAIELELQNVWGPPREVADDE